MKKNKNTYFIRFIATFFIISGLSLIIFSAVPTLKEFIYHKNQEIFYNQLINPSHPFKKIPVGFSNLITSSYPLTTTIPTPSATPTVLKQYEPLLKTNPEVVGWITIDDTPINYPLVQHADNQYYLNHDISNATSIYGSIYIDHRNDSSLHNQNTLIYGHNMNNGSMFHTLVNFKKRDFFEKHPYILMSNLYEQSTYEVFAVYVVDANTETIATDYEDDDAFLSYLKSCEKRSLFKREMHFNKNDEIITLVTCSYELDNARTIVQAKRNRN